MVDSVKRESQKSTGLIAICGNPNCGKTTIFNAVTGLNQQVGNYSGVTVEKVTGTFTAESDHKEKYTLVDIPGTYSLSAFSPDEYIAASSLYSGIDGERLPDSIICVIDATTLERSLYLLLQVLQIGKPVVVAINMIDIARRRGHDVDCELLSQQLGGLPVIPIVANKGTGISQLKSAAAAAVSGDQQVS
ncbi:MAG: FeoB small GTPase domain-containing protein, partial [bacterium]|nr:FeoB small GTPase domain-containing protein [bacterium]